MIETHLNPALRHRLLLPALLAALWLGAAALPGTPVHVPYAAAQGVSVHYPAGWNLVAAPTGTVLSQAAGTLYTFRPVSDAYQPVDSNGIVGGRSVWAFFPSDVTLSLGPTAADFTRIIVPAEHFVLVGNPSTTQTLPIHGADVALAYDARSGYSAVTQLSPGQGAFALSFQGGDITVGTPPASADGLRALQLGLTQDAADVTNFAKMPGVSEQLLNARQYAAVQAGIDDVNASFADGLVSERAATPPQLTDSQRSNAASVREDLAKAQAATAAGDTATADAAITHARQMAQASEDAAVAVARSQSPSTSSLLLSSAFRYAATTYTPQSLARYGTLCTATVPALGLNLPPTMPFVGVVVAVLNNQPVPPAATPTPAPGH